MATSSSYVRKSSGTRYDIATRAMIVTLKNFTTLKNAEIADIVGCSERHVQTVNQIARERGYTSGPIKNVHVAVTKKTPRARAKDASVEATAMATDVVPQPTSEHSDDPMS